MPGEVLRHWHGQRNGEDRLGIDRSHRPGDEVGRGPDLVDGVEGRAHDVGKLLDLPEPITGGVTAIEKGPADVAREPRRAVGVHAQDVDVVRHAIASALDKRVRLAAERRVVRRRRERNAGGLDGVHQLPGSLADAKLGAKVSGDVEPLGERSRSERIGHH